MSYRIVVADKDPRSRETVTRFLLSEDNEFVSVSDSNELKQAIKAQKPDLIILNAVLADAPGWKLVPRIKDSKEYSDVPIILMTGDPGSPPPAQVHAVGADKYLSKPLDGRVLKEAVQSLLGIGTAAEDEAVSEEIMIDFADEDSGDMTEELLQMSNVALQRDETPTDVGDTVEIDTGTLVAELDHPGELTGEETYEDTVRLNLEDMGLDDEIDDAGTYEPTIELISDIPSDTPSDELLEAVQLESPPERSLPDFSAVGAGAESQGKDSITIEMDVDDLGMELDLEESEERTATMRVETIDVDDTEIGQILEVQEPSKVITSEDLFLDDESLVKESVAETPTTGIEVIDLEEDAELREIDLEELEPIQAGQESSIGLELDETVPIEGLEMEQLANEELLEGALDEEDISLELESPLEAAGGYETPEELTLEEIAEEEITTQEFFGEELPTEEFPTEKFPEDKTADLRLEQEITLDDGHFRDQYGLGEKPTTAEIPVDEITLDTASAEEILFQEAPEDEPILEVTEDISFDEITLQEIDEVALGAKRVEAPKTAPEPAAWVPTLAPAVGTLAAVSAAPPVAPAVAEKAQVPPPDALGAQAPTAPVSPPAPTPPPQQPAAMAGVSAHEIAGIISSSLGNLLSQAMPAKSQLADTVDSALKSALPTKQQLSDSYGHTLEANLPSKQEVLETLAKQIAATLPSREEVSSRVDELVAKAIPSSEAIAAKVDQAVKNALPSSEAILERLVQAVQVMPWTQDVAMRLEKTLEALPSANAVNLRIDAALGGMPSPEEIRDRVDEALEALPSADAVNLRIDTALGGMPSPEEIRGRIDKAVEGLPSADAINLRIDAALEGMPSPEEIRGRIEKAIEALPNADLIKDRLDAAFRELPNRELIEAKIDSALAELGTDKVMARVDRALDALPTQEEVMGRVDRSLSSFPTAEDVLSLVDQRLSATLPEKQVVTQAMQEMLSEKVSNAFIEVELKQTLLDMLPTTDEILNTMRSALPERDRLQETITRSLTVAIENSLPERVWLETVSRGLFDERTKGSLPKKEEIVSLIKEEIRGKLLDTVEKSVREQIEKMTAELSS